MSLVLQLLLTGRVLRTRRRRPGALHRADGDADGIDRRADARHARRGRRAEGQRPGAALFDRQGDGRTALPAGAGRAHLPREVVHRHRGLPARRCGRRARGAALCRRCSAGRRCRCRSVGIVLRRRVDGRRLRGAAAVRREPAREHPPASRRFRARLDAGDGSRHRVADLVAAEGRRRSEIAYALSLFEMAHDRKVHPAVRGLLHHEDAEIRQQAIRLLARAGDATREGRGRGSWSRIRTSTCAPRRCCT